MRHKIALLFVAGLGVSCGATPTPRPSVRNPGTVVEGVATANLEANRMHAEATLTAELDQLWELQMVNSPQWATYRGDRRFDDKLDDTSHDGRARYLTDYKVIADRIAAIDSSVLSPDSRDTQAMVAIEAHKRLNQFETCQYHRWSVNGLGGPQVRFPMMPVFFPIRDTKDLKNLEARYRATGTQISQRISNLRKGLSEGYTATRANVKRAITQLENGLKIPLDSDPMLKIKTTDPQTTYDTLGLKLAIKEVVRPALRRYLDVLKTEVLPQSRDLVGVSEIPQGSKCYELAVEGHIGPGFTPQELHQIGLAELKWAHEGMLEVAKKLGKKPKDARAFMEEMAHDTSNFVRDEASLLKLNRDAVSRATSALPKMFTRLPKAQVEVRPIEAHRAASAPAAYYNSPPEDGSRPGIYYCNTYQPETRPLYNLEALAYHEANPGHHFQTAISQELPAAHVWRQNAGQTAFTEGWALYAEILADEMGLYSSPQTKFGMYNYQAWRAARLVVDTGLHAMGWTRQQAIDFLAQNTALKRNEIENEIDRYIAWPGQALSYMVGRRKIQELRLRASTALGDAFDVRAFHDEIVGHGAVPLELLDKNINAWIAAQAAK